MLLIIGPLIMALGGLSFSRNRDRRGDIASSEIIIAGALIFISSFVSPTPKDYFYLIVGGIIAAVSITILTKIYESENAPSSYMGLTAAWLLFALGVLTIAHSLGHNYWA